jgi:hypothetical protein
MDSITSTRHIKQSPTGLLWFCSISGKGPKDSLWLVSGDAYPLTQAYWPAVGRRSQGAEAGSRESGEAAETAESGRRLARGLLAG